MRESHEHAAIVELFRETPELWPWPAYVWLLRRTYRCPVRLLVITPDAAVAAWAAQPITCGPECVTRALVVGPGQIPGITEALRRSERSPAGRGDASDARTVNRMVMAVLEVLREGRHGDMTGEITEDQMQLSELVARLTRQQAAFLEQAQRNGLLERSRAEGMQDSILRVMARRGVVLSPEQEADIRRTYGIDELEYWIDRAVTANSAEELFADPMD